MKSRSWKNSAQPIALNVCLNEQMNAAARKIDTKIKKEAKTVNNQILLYFITNNLSNCTIVKIIYYFVQLGKALSHLPKSVILAAVKVVSLQKS